MSEDREKFLLPDQREESDSIPAAGPSGREAGSAALPGPGSRPLLDSPHSRRNLHPAFRKLESFARQKKEHIPTLILTSRDMRCPLYARLLALLALSYCTTPFPLVPHAVPYIGGIDMVTIAPSLIAAAIELKPYYVVTERRREASQLGLPTLPVAWGMSVVFVAIWALAPLIFFIGIPSWLDLENEAWATICFIVYLLGVAYYFYYAKKRWGGMDYDLSRDPDIAGSVSDAAPRDPEAGRVGIVVGYPVAPPPSYTPTAVLQATPQAPQAAQPQ